jgi:hypothetical protein
MTKRAMVSFLAFAILAGCKNQAKTTANASAATSAVPQQLDSPNASPTGVSAAPKFTDAPIASVAPRYSDPPSAGVGPSVEQAYAANPHRRTIWEESGSTVPSGEKEYLQTVFEVLDQAVRFRVAGQQAFSSQQYDSADIDAEFDRLIMFVREMPAPKTLVSYHQDILSALSNQRQFFNEWKSQRDQFAFAQQVGNHPGVRAASASLRAAYGELMSKYPNESQTNKDAFFDYHCALDFL